MHSEIAGERWQSMPLVEQMANIGSEVGRALRAAAAGNAPRAEKALDRALELFDMTVADLRWRHRLKEVLRAREIFCAACLGVDPHATKDARASLDRYFTQFAVAARLHG